MNELKQKIVDNNNLTNFFNLEVNPAIESHYVQFTAIYIYLAIMTLIISSVLIIKKLRVKENKMKKDVLELKKFMESWDNKSVNETQITVDKNITPPTQQEDNNPEGDTTTQSNWFS